MDLANPIFEIPEENNTRSQKIGRRGAPVMRVRGRQFRRHKLNRVREANSVLSKAGEEKVPVASVGNRIFYEVQFHESATAKSTQPRPLLDKNHIDVYAQISERTFLASSTTENLSLFQQNIQGLTVGKNKSDSAYLSAISKISTIKKRDKLTFTPKPEGKLRAYLFLADVLSDEEGRTVAENIQRKTEAEAEYFVAESGAKVIYGSFARRFIDEISDDDPRSPIVRIEKSIDFFASEELPTEYDYETVTIDDPELDARVAVVDTGILDHPLMRSRVIGTENCINDPTKEDLMHGTFVAGRVMFGNNIEEQVRAQGRLRAQSRVLDVRVLKKRGFLTSDKEIVDALLQVIKNPTHRDVKVFNLSLNDESDQSLSAGTKSFFTRQLDSIAHKYKVCIVVTAGNQQTYMAQDYPRCLTIDSSLITSPGDIVNGLTIGSLADSHSTRAMALIEEPSPFSRAGLTGQKKPDLVHYGGNCDGYGNCGGIGVKSFALNTRRLAEGVGTSYSAPLVSSITAQIYAYLKSVGRESVDLTKALLLHSASYQLPLDSNINQEDLRRLIGFGKPDLQAALNCANSAATFFYTGTIQNDEENDEIKEYKHKVKFHIPAELAQMGKALKVRGTLVYTPLISEMGQNDYTLADIEVNLHYKNSRGTDTSAGLTRDSNDHRPRWTTIKSFERTFSNQPRTSYSAGEWEIWLNLTARGKADNNGYTQDYAMVLTVEDVSPDTTHRLNVAEIIREQFSIYTPISQRVRTRIQT